MYVLKTTPKITETVQIGDKIIEIRLDAETIAVEFNKRVNELIAAEQRINKAAQSPSDALTEDAVAEYSRALMLVMSLVFGTDNANAIVDFYEGSFMEMAIEVIPFITNKIVPSVKVALADLQKRAAEQYKNAKRATLTGRREK